MLGTVTRRNLNLHEYQSKEVMDSFGIPTQVGYVASTPEEVKLAGRKLLNQGVGTLVLKSQVFAGGRGKGSLDSGLKGGIQFTKSADAAGEIAKKMLGYKLVTHQTDANGLLVEKILVTEGVDVDKEFYLAIVLDRSAGGPVIVVSRKGGVDIEEVSASDPNALVVVPIDIRAGITDRNLEAVVEVLFPDVAKSVPSNAADLTYRQQTAIYNKLISQTKDTVKQLYNLFIQTDASQVEINPLAVTSDDRVLCIDAKLNFDDNAKFRQAKLFAQEDLSNKCPRELDAETMGMNYVTMDGSVGCLVNGAGLAMATMDILKVFNGEPANFLDLGGGATKEQVLKSFELLTKDPKVKSIFVNIFGGITRCDVVAQGIIDAAREMKIEIPLVIRLVGNNAEIAREMINSKELKQTGLNITYVQDFTEAAKVAVMKASQ